MSASTDAEGEPKRPQRRGLIRSALKLARHAGAGVEAAAELGMAEARLARAALPHAVFWFFACILFGTSLTACGWVALLYWLVQRTGSVGIALVWMAGISAFLLAAAIVMLVRMLRLMRFNESRRRLRAFLGGNDAPQPE